MARPRIALFGDRGSEQLQWLGRAVDLEGGEPNAFDIQLGGASQSRVSYSAQSARWDDVDFADINAVHIRCNAPNTLPTLPPVLNAMSHNDYRGQFLREQAAQSATYGFFEELVAAGKLVINPLTAGYIDHNTKGQFYEKLRSWGFDTPATLTTNDPDAARDFLDTMGEAVVKPAIGVGSTRLVTRADSGRLDEFRVCPVLMQERIRGHVVRVHVVGDRVVLSLRILAEHIDSRTATEGFEFHRLPAAEEARLVAASRRLGLHFCAWDIMVTAASRYTWLDCNPGPYILWIGEHYVAAVLTQLARYLVAYAQTGSVAAAAARVEPFQSS
jgi:hypothetical protein